MNCDEILAANIGIAKLMNVRLFRSGQASAAQLAMCFV